MSPPKACCHRTLRGVPGRARLEARTDPVAGCHPLFARDRRTIMMASWYRALFPTLQVAGLLEPLTERK
jgi:hypothetical protein